MDESESDRDPSFFSCRPVERKAILSAIPRNLCGSMASLVNNEHYKVHLRIKPNASSNKPFTIIDSNTLQATVPKESVTYKVLESKKSPLINRNFTFSSILNEDSTQSDVFHECIVPRLQSFLHGEDCAVMAYGTTSAGKTYTMQGSVENPGMIPRSLSYIFNALDGTLAQCDDLQPCRGAQLTRLTEEKRKTELLFKNRILSLDLTHYQKNNDISHITYKSFDDDGFESVMFKKIESNIERASDFDGVISSRCTIWVSMVEIYNDIVMDLLEFPSERGELKSLSLGEDERGGFYVKNLRYVHVRNGHEAFQVAQFGRTNLHRAATQLNDKSSRSHCIFTITQVTHGEGHCVTTFSFVDLAGSERAKKTHNSGKRLVESNSINRSLSVLGKCLVALKNNQLRSKLPMVVPIRDSKITRLLKSAFLGKQKLSFIINISTEPNIFDETLHALKFSALAQEIVPESKTRFSKIFNKRLQEPNMHWSMASSTSDLTTASYEPYISQLREKLQMAERRVDELEENEVEMKRTEAALKRENDKFWSRMGELEDLVRQLEFEKDAYQTKVAELCGQNKTLRITANQLAYDSMVKLREEHRQEVETYREKLQTSDNTIAVQAKKIKQLKRELKKLHEAFDESSLKIASEALEQENDKLRSQVKSLEDLLGEAEQFYKDALKTVQSRENEIESLTDDLTRVRESDEEKQVIINEHKSYIEHLEDETARLKRESCSLQEELLAMKEAMTLLEEEAIARQKDAGKYQRLSEEEEQLCAGNRSLRNELLGLKESLAHLEVEVAADSDADDKMLKLEDQPLKVETELEKKLEETPLEREANVLKPRKQSLTPDNRRYRDEDKENFAFQQPKSERKARTGRKRDPLDHPALSVEKGRSVSSPPVPRPARSARKKMFALEDFIDLDDQSDLMSFVSPMPMPKRSTRLRSRLNHE